MKTRIDNRISGPRRIVAAAFLVLLPGLAGCMDLTTPDPADEFPIEEVEFAASLGIDLDDFEERGSGLWMRTDQMGMPPNAGPGNLVEVAFRGWLPSGDLITESEPGEPYAFYLGGFDVLPGVQEGVDEMSVGAIRTILVPPHLGYGASPPEGIPRNTWLVYELELISVDGQDGGPG